MIKTLIERARQGYRTAPYPSKPPVLPARFRGRPALDLARCPADCAACVAACPVGAIRKIDGKPVLDLGRCLFCGDCQSSCPHGALRFTSDHKLAARKKNNLLFDGSTAKRLEPMDGALRRLFGRSLRLRQVSAGGCNACEADTNVLGTLAFDLGRFGIQFVASPRHADGILVTGPVTANMHLALLKTYEAVPDPRFVIALGSCAISGGPYAGHPEAHDGIPDSIPVDLYIPGCPPHPITILDGLLSWLGRIDG